MKELARLFETLCIGTYSGHMAEIPHNPTIKAIFDAMGQEEFSDKLSKLAELLVQDSF